MFCTDSPKLDLLYRAMQLADRVSVNLEGPTQERLSSLAPKKDFMGELLKMLQWAETIRQENPYQNMARTVTQFVVGAVGDTDQELLALSNRLYRQMGLTRAYYCGFHPVEQTPFENLSPTGPIHCANIDCSKPVFCSGIMAGASRICPFWRMVT